MAIEQTLGPGLHNLYPVSNGMTSWWNLRLFVTHNTGTGGAQVTLKVNGQDIPDQGGAVYAQVDPITFPRRSVSIDTRLNDGDIIQAQVDGLDTVDIALSGEVLSEQL